MEKSKFNISAVHRLTGKARSTISNHLKAGKVSYILDDDGNKLIEASEIIRVYGDELELDSDGKIKTKTDRNVKRTEVKNDASEHSQAMLKQEKLERDRERKQLQETIENLRTDLEKSQDRESRATLLLENQSSESDRWLKQMAEIEKRIANQELETKRYRRALIEERNRGFWERLFG